MHFYQIADVFVVVFTLSKLTSSVQVVPSSQDRNVKKPSGNTIVFDQSMPDCNVHNGSCKDINQCENNHRISKVDQPHSDEEVASAIVNFLKNLQECKNILRKIEHLSRQIKELKQKQDLIDKKQQTFRNWFSSGKLSSQSEENSKFLLHFHTLQTTQQTATRFRDPIAVAIESERMITAPQKDVPATMDGRSFNTNFYRSTPSTPAVVLSKTNTFGGKGKVAEPTRHQELMTEPTRHQYMMTELTRHQDLMTEPTRHQDLMTEPTRHQELMTELTRHQDLMTEQTRHQDLMTKLSRYQEPMTDSTRHQTSSPFEPISIHFTESSQFQDDLLLPPTQSPSNILGMTSSMTESPLHTFDDVVLLATKSSLVEGSAGSMIETNTQTTYPTENVTFNKLNAEFNKQNLRPMRGEIQETRAIVSSAFTSPPTTSPQHSTTQYQKVGSNAKTELSRDCAELFLRGERRNGVYPIRPRKRGVWHVFCDMKIDGGGWTTIQKRTTGKVNFTRDWKNYKDGFGNVFGDFWLGLDKIHYLTTSDKQKRTVLRIDLTDWYGVRRFAQYDVFKVRSESRNYQLIVRKYHGSAGDGLSHRDNNTHHLTFFSTFDRDNDLLKQGNCAQMCGAGWWYNACFSANLNGYYNNESVNRTGIYWGNGHKVLDTRPTFWKVDMKIRPLVFPAN